MICKKCGVDYSGRYCPKCTYGLTDEKIRKEKEQEQLEKEQEEKSINQFGFDKDNPNMMNLFKGNDKKDEISNIHLIYAFLVFAILVCAWIVIKVKNLA